MRLIQPLFALAVILAFASRAGAQEPPKPGKEHKELAKMAGEWEVTGEGVTGSSAFKMTLGGLWLESSFKGSFGGMEFEGKGLDTYDAAKKKYVSVWVDSMGTTPLNLEGNFDKEGKTLTMEGEGPGPGGPKTKFKTVTEHVDENTMNFTMSGDGQVMVKFTYKRKKSK